MKPAVVKNKCCHFGDGQVSQDCRRNSFHLPETCSALSAAASRARRGSVSYSRGLSEQRRAWLSRLVVAGTRHAENSSREEAVQTKRRQPRKSEAAGCLRTQLTGIYNTLAFNRAVTGIAVSCNGSSVFTTSQGMSCLPA